MRLASLSAICWIGAPVVRLCYQLERVTSSRMRGSLLCRIADAHPRSAGDTSDAVRKGDVAVLRLARRQGKVTAEALRAVPILTP